MDKTKQLGEASIPKLLFTFSVPAIVGMIVNSIYNMIDRMFIGNSPSLGVNGLAGITICFPLMLIIMAVGMLFGLGGQILYSINQGQNDKEGAQKAFSTTVALLFISGIIITVLGIIFAEPVLLAFGADSETLPYAKEYIIVIFAGVIFQNLGYGINTFLRADGMPQKAMVTMLIGAFTNIILDYVFIIRFDWGMFGAAFATVLGQVATAAFVLSHYLDKKSPTHFRLKYVCLKPKFVLRITAFGMSSALLQTASCVLNIILNRSVLKYGAESVYGSAIAMSGIGVINSLATIFVMPVVGINQGSQPIISYNLGAQKMDRVKKTFVLALISATVLIICGYIVTRLFPEPIIAMFTDDPQLLDFSKKALKIWFLMLPIVSINIIGSNFFQAIGKVSRAIVLSISRQILFLIPAILILGYFMGLDGILWAVPVADILSVILTGICLIIEFRSPVYKTK